MTVVSSSVRDLNAYAHVDKPLWNAIALAYTIGGYFAGVGLLLSSNGWLNASGVILLSHTLFLSVVFTHEFMHSTIFAQQCWNEWGGSVMLWLNGGCYARFRDLTRWHIAHHSERCDFPAVDIPTFLQQLPKPILKLIFALEWFYFPAIAFLMQWRSLTRPFWSEKRKDERLRTTVLLILRGMMFTGLAFLSLKAIVLYFVAYVGMHLIMQFMNAFFHTYQPYWSEEELQRDWNYEQSNTFSCLISQQYWWINLIVLNFGYHNAHHAVMRCPWHSLHELERKLFPFQQNATSHRFTVWQMLGNYHRYRVSRILSGHGQVIDEAGNYSFEDYYGDVGVGFMILPV